MVYLVVFVMFSLVSFLPRIDVFDGTQTYVYMQVQFLRNVTLSPSVFRRQSAIRHENQRIMAL